VTRSIRATKRVRCHTSHGTALRVERAIPTASSSLAASIHSALVILPAPSRQYSL